MFVVWVLEVGGRRICRGCSGGHYVNEKLAMNVAVVATLLHAGLVCCLHGATILRGTEQARRLGC